MADEALEEIIIQALGHKERRSVIKMLGVANGGIMYSDILHELAINTGKLNYHLKLLEGLIEKDEKRRYRLTKLGTKAHSTLYNITSDLDEETVKSIKSTKTQRDEFITGAVNLYSRIILGSIVSALIGVEAFIYFLFREDITNPTAVILLLLPALLLAVIYWYLNKLKKDAPEVIIGFLQRLGFYR